MSKIGKGFWTTIVTQFEAFTKIHVEFTQLPYLMSPWRQLQLQGVALGLIRLPEDQGYTFTHSHAEQEEVYIVVEGQGMMCIDGELFELAQGDIVRVSPKAKRALKAATNSHLFVICVGGVVSGYPKAESSRYFIDDGIPHYEDIPPWYAENNEIAQHNASLQERMLRAQARRESRQAIKETPQV